MRIIALGLGGAGCRIVNSLYAIDRRSSKVACVQGLAVDVDENTMKQLTALPESGRMCFSADAEMPDLSGTEIPKASIDINEIISRVQNLETGENDAIVLCCGLGGSMVDVAPHIIAGLRSSVVEPIFGLVTLPCLAEGERISGKAADDIDMLSSLLDGIIVFDNETWHKKIKTQRAGLPKREKGFAEKIGLIKSENALPPVQATYRNLNEAIVRRIGLMLRAGEFRADGGLDLAEVVLDSGEVLNTMKGMGFITIGYAVEKLSSDPLRFLSWLRPAGLSDEEQKKRASRIVELAKQAIYHEISTPCDLTSAHKALVLIAGPSHELSMKGFMTVRKWIDRSIAGLETRSGDYPVMNTQNVAIIVMLSGLENIPRITELREIRSQAKSKKTGPREEGKEAETREHPVARDDMITVPARMSRADDSDRRVTAARETPRIVRDENIREMEPALQKTEEIVAEQPQQPPQPVIPDIPRQAPQVKSIPVPEPAPEAESRRVPDVLSPARRRVIVARAEKEQPHHRLPTHSLPPHERLHPGKAGAAERPRTEPAAHPAGEGIPPPMETERQRIERELRRQRSMAIGGRSPKTAPPAGTSTEKAPEKQVIRRSIPHLRPALDDEVPVHGEVPAVPPEVRKTIVIGKRRIAPVHEEEEPGTPAVGEPTGTGHADAETESPDRNVEIKDTLFRARDGIFEGKGVRKSSLPPVRDSTLLHTELKSKKKSSPTDTQTSADVGRDTQSTESPPAKKRTLAEKP